jgi:tetratricopeptide (TPR) repeat protein
MPQVVSAREQNIRRSIRRSGKHVAWAVAVVLALVILTIAVSSLLAKHKFDAVSKQDQRLQGQGNYAEDKKLLSAYINSNPPKPYKYPILLRLGDLAFGEGKYSEAATWYLRANTLHPNNVHVTVQLAMISEQLGDRASAITYWRKAINLTPPSNGSDIQQYQEAVQRLEGKR